MPEARQINREAVEALMNRPPEEIFRPSEAFWAKSVPTYMENWPPELHRLSFASSILRLSQQELVALGSHIIELGEGFAPEPQSIDSLRTQVSSLASTYPNGCFVRLGSRSPKDAMYWGCHPGDDKDGRVRTGDEALRRLLCASERVYDDLQMARSMKYDPAIVLREWVDIPEWAEFRCFMKNRQLVGISQYYYRKFHPEIVKHKDTIKFAIETLFFPEFRAACHLDDVVFDVFVKIRKCDDRNPFSPRGLQYSVDSGECFKTEVKLIEINPFFSFCDPCLYDWNDPEMFKKQFKFIRNTEDLIRRR